VYESVLAEEPAHFDALHLLGVACAQTEELLLAVDLLSKAVALNKSHAVARNNLGNALADLKDWPGAIESYNHAVKLDPRYALAYFNRGIAQEELGSVEGALASYQKATQINPANSQAQSNCGLMFQTLRRLDEALLSFDRAIKADPQNAEAYSNRGNVLRDLMRHAESIADFDRALEIDPQFADAYWNKSITHLFMGQWATAWDLYPWRWRRSDLGPEDPRPPLYHDRFERAAEKPETLRVCIWAEQGVGDEVFHASMFAEAVAHFGSVTIQVDPRLITLLNRSTPGAVFVDKAFPVDFDNFDLHLAHGDLGYFFRREIGDFQRVQLRYLQPDDDRTKALRAELQTEGKLLCGITWRSKNKRLGGDKSISLDKLLPILKNPSFRFVNLQYGNTVDELTAFKAEHGVDIINCASVDNFSDLDGHAALIQACDLVVTVSNSTAHIAGALGKPSYVMLSQGDGRLWYWANRYGKQSMWYPAIQIYEQARYGDWGEVISDISTTIKKEYIGSKP
jgi:tetratricopeptide (TPR) repeat protein